MKSAQNTKAPQARSRIFIVDDHPITRYGLAQLINREPDLQVCGEGGSAHQALAAIKSAQPDLVLVDIAMPGKSGLDLIKNLQTFYPGAVVLVMSMHDEGLYAERVLRAGGRGYIMKSEGGEKLLEAVRHVLSGKVYVSKRISELILENLTRPRPAASDDRPGTLSDREFEIFQLIGEGLSSREIAQRLSLSIKTIGTHRIHIKEKLKLRTGSELIKQATRWAATQQLL
jgi:DNA-binding NarL/FixJ family response regulator